MAEVGKWILAKDGTKMFVFTMEVTGVLVLEDVDVTDVLVRIKDMTKVLVSIK